MHIEYRLKASNVAAHRVAGKRSWRVIRCSKRFGAFLNTNPVQNHLNSGAICRAFADMVQTYDPGRVNKHITTTLKDIAC